MIVQRRLLLLALTLTAGLAHAATALASAQALRAKYDSFGHDGGDTAMTSVGLSRFSSLGHPAVWSNTIAFPRDLPPDLGGFLELTSCAGDGRHVAIFHSGFTCGLADGGPFDLGAYIGISRKFSAGALLL